MTNTLLDPRTLFARIGLLFEHAHLSEADVIAREAADALEESCSEAAAHLGRFAEEMSAIGLHKREEIYLRTFDLNPSCPPYMSVHLFGEESFKRAILMTGLAAAYDRAGFDRGGELPDHLGVVLRFAPQFDDEEWTELARFCLATPLVRMGAVLSPTNNPYRHAVAALHALLRADFTLETVSCSTSSSSLHSLTSPCSSCSLGPSGDSGVTDTATPPCPLSSLKTASSCGGPSPGTSASW
jgi:nitrate reductase delta subunit